jgi:hypothetical protein
MLYFIVRAFLVDGVDTAATAIKAPVAPVAECK